MAELPRPGAASLQIRGLNVYYGNSHALQGVDLTIERGVLAVVGRNGMGKTTLCKTLMGLVRAASGSIRFGGEELTSLAPADIARLGIGYVPQGRRLWPSLSVDEHLRLAASKRGAWSIARIYDTFPRLGERKRNLGGQLSGGEQQMLAIARALLLNPRALVMDEPTEGLAPVIVAQVEDMLIRLARESDMTILLIEQNIRVATVVSETVAIMVNGRVNRIIAADRLAADRDLQQRLLGVGRHAHEAVEDVDTDAAVSEAPSPGRPRGVARVYVPGPAAVAPLRPLSATGDPVVLVVGTLDTKGEELRFVRDILQAHGLHTKLVDVSTGGLPSAGDVPPHLLAAYAPNGPAQVFSRDRGIAVGAMTQAFEGWLRRQSGIAGAIAAGGSGGTAIVAPGLRALPVGVPKLIVSTVASGNVATYVGGSDITMMHSVTDVQGLNSISRQVLANAAHALAGMVKGRLASPPARASTKPAVGLTMFGVTTPCVRGVVKALGDEAECLVFHATGTGGQCMESLVASGHLTGVIDATTTEVCDLLLGGIFPAAADRLEAIVQARIPYIGSCGALDMANFGPPESVPPQFAGRLLHRHNPNVTLMRTNAAECARVGAWIGERLNRMDAPVRFLLPEGGVSALDAPGQVFFDPAADAALFEALLRTVRQTTTRQILRLPYHINDPRFAAELVACYRALHVRPRTRQNAAP